MTLPGFGRRELPKGSKSRRLLNQSTHSSVANSTACNDRHGPRRWMISQQRPLIRLGESIVITVADAAHRRLDARLHQPRGVLDRDVLGGSKRSSQHLKEEVATNIESGVRISLDGHYCRHPVDYR